MSGWNRLRRSGRRRRTHQIGHHRPGGRVGQDRVVVARRGDDRDRGQLAPAEVVVLGQQAAGRLHQDDRRFGSRRGVREDEVVVAAEAGQREKAI